MSQKQINHSTDLKRLQDEGYELEVNEGHAIIYDVPYLKSDGIIDFGILVSPINFQGDKAVYANDHVIYFCGEQPCRSDGSEISGIMHGTDNTVRAGILCNFCFSNRPATGYRDYYHKITRYIEIISGPAIHKDNNITATTFRRIVSDDNSMFIYEDTNSSRCGITAISNKLKNQKIGIIGLGGTGSYVLDLVAKTPVSEICLFDGDAFCQHNAFRAPGAPEKCIFEEGKNKAEYFKELYSNMHKTIIAYPTYLDDNTMDFLKNLDFVFICIDSGKSKKIIINDLIENKIRFIDTGIDVNVCDEKLLGSLRNTAFFNPTNNEKLKDGISYDEIHNDVYSSSIQTAELNSLCAVMAVIRWKKEIGFYQDLNPASISIYDTNDGEFKYES